MENGRCKCNKAFSHMYTYDFVKLVRNDADECVIREFIYQYRDLYWYDSLKMVALVATIKRVDSELCSSLFRTHIYRRILKEWWV